MQLFIKVIFRTLVMLMALCTGILFMVLFISFNDAGRCAIAPGTPAFVDPQNDIDDYFLVPAGSYTKVIDRPPHLQPMIEGYKCIALKPEKSTDTYVVWIRNQDVIFDPTAIFKRQIIRQYYRLINGNINEPPPEEPPMPEARNKLTG